MILLEEIVVKKCCNQRGTGSAAGYTVFDRYSSGITPVIVLDKSDKMGNVPS